MRVNRMKHRDNPRTKALEGIMREMSRGSLARVTGIVRLTRLRAKGLITDHEWQEATNICSVPKTSGPKSA